MIQINKYNYFFFSSRRRHTRFDCDWSSDVCSSDLKFPAASGVAAASTTPVNVTVAVDGLSSVTVPLRTTVWPVMVAADSAICGAAGQKRVSKRSSVNRVCRGEGRLRTRGDLGSQPNIRAFS